MSSQTPDDHITTAENWLEASHAAKSVDNQIVALLTSLASTNLAIAKLANAKSKEKA